MSKNKAPCPVVDRTPRLRRQADRFSLRCTATQWLGWDEAHPFRCAAGHAFPLTPRQLAYKSRGCPVCVGFERLRALHARAQREGLRCMSTEWAGVEALYLFECAQGHQWQRSAHQATRCLKCAAQAAALARRDPAGLSRLQQAAATNGGQCLSEAYTKLAAPYRFRCALGHEWTVRGDSVVLQGYWCPDCAHAQGERRRSPRPGLARLRDAAQAKGGECLDDRYVDSASRYRFRCAKGHEWSVIGASVLKGSWCELCGFATRGAGQRRPDGLLRLQELAAARGGECLSTEYKGLNHPVRLRCAQGHEWEVKAEGPLSGKWCRFCHADARRLSIADAHAAAAARGGQCLSRVYVDAHTHLTWMCDRGHVWQANLNNVRSSGTWCPQCQHMAKISNRKSKARAKYHAAGPAPE